MTSSRFSLAVALCLLMVTHARAGSAQQVQPLDPEWLQKMYAEGWRKVQEGVLQRDVGKGQVETFGYGAEGLQWVVDGYEKQVLQLEAKLEQSPDASLVLAIARLKKEIARLSESSVAAPSTRSFDNQTLENCTPSFGGEAYAGPQSNAVGVVANASAYFYNDCGHLGDTFATAYAHAIQGTVETTTIQNDPKNGGSSIDSQAVASVNGSTGCESWAQATVTSSDLSISYQTPLAQNFNCQAPFYDNQRITIIPSMVSLDGPQSDGDPGLLVDEQELAGDPRNGDRNNPTTSWNTIFNPHVNTAIIDLGSHYHIYRIYLYDTFGAGGGASGNFTVIAGSSSTGETVLVSDPLSYYLVWQGFPNNTSNDSPSYTDDPALELEGVVTRYLRIVNPTGYLGMPEIVIYGIPAPV